MLDLKKRDLREFKIFYEMIFIPIKTKEMNFNEIEKKFLNMLDYKKKKFLESLRIKIKMIIEELKCFKETIKDYEKYTLIYIKEYHNSKKMKKIHEKVKNEKNEIDLTNKIYHSEMRLKRLEELLSLLSLVIIKNQYPEMRKRKKKRFSKIINIFAHQELSHLEQELSFWETIESLTEN